MTAVLEAKGLYGGYGQYEVLHHVDVSAATGSAVAIIGPNGAGKTTLLRALSGHAQCTRGEISLQGTDLSSLPAHARTLHGLVHVPEGRRLFPELTVDETLRLAAAAGGRAVGDRRGYLNREEVLELFPSLKRRLRSAAALLSGGEQQMLALARALLCRPLVLMLDEPSLGLSPRAVDEVYVALQRLMSRSLALLIVEQNITHSLTIASEVHVMERGSFVLSGSPSAIADNPAVADVYLGGPHA